MKIIALAAAGKEEELAKLVARKAEISLGSGDVNIPMGNGVTGIRALSVDLKAATYSYHGWDYIPERRDPCGQQKVEVEFVNAAGDRSATIEFKFDHGILTSAKGWWRSRNFGPVSLKASHG